MTLLDPRLNAFRADLADEKLGGTVEAESFVAGKLKRVAVPIAPVLKTPNAEARQVSQALYGEDCLVFEDQDGFAWVQLRDDSYVGYVSTSHLDEIQDKITHSVCVPHTFAFPRPDIKSRPPEILPLNAKLSVTDFDGVTPRFP